MAESGETTTARPRLTESALRSLPASGGLYPLHGYEAAHQDGSPSQAAAECGTSVDHSLEPLEPLHRVLARLPSPESVDSVAFGVTDGRAIAQVDTDLNDDLAQPDDDLAQPARPDHVGPEPQRADGPIVVTGFTATRDAFEVERAMADVDNAFAATDAGPPARRPCGIGLAVAVLLAVAIPTALLATATMSVSITAGGAVLFAAVALVTFKMIR